MQRPPYEDPATGQSHDLSAPRKAGWLKEQSHSHSHSHSLEGWQRRYFVLQGARLFFAEGELCAPHGVIDISAVVTVRSGRDSEREIEVRTKDQTYFLLAETEREKDEWIGAIGRGVVQAMQASMNLMADEEDDYSNEDDEEDE